MRKFHETRGLTFKRVARQPVDVTRGGSLRSNCFFFDGNASGLDYDHEAQKWWWTALRRVCLILASECAPFI